MLFAVFGSLLILLAYAIAAYLRGWDHEAPPGDSGSDDGGGRGPGPRRPPAPSGGGIPVTDATQARVRLRGHGRLADVLPARRRRPSREPGRPPARPRTF